MILHVIHTNIFLCLTIDSNFLNVQQIKIKAPGMEISDWIERYGKQRM